MKLDPALTVGVLTLLHAAYLVVLIGRDGNEGSLREDVGAESCVFWAKAVVLVCLDNMEARLVFVHGV